MSDVYAKLGWAEKHLADLMDLAHEYLRPGGGDERPIGIQFDNSRPPVVLATFIIEKPVPVEISLHAGDLVHGARSCPLAAKGPLSRRSPPRDVSDYPLGRGMWKASFILGATASACADRYTGCRARLGY